MQEYLIDGVKVKVFRECNLNTINVIDCLLDLFLQKEKQSIKEGKEIQDKGE